MFLSIALSRVAPVLFPGLSEAPDSRTIAHNAALMVEKVSVLEREIAEMLQQELRTLGTHPLIRESSPSTTIGQTEGQGQGHEKEGVVREVDDVVDERAMRLLTREMQRMVIEGRLENEPRLNREGVDDGFVDARKRAVDAFRSREQERQRWLEERAGFHGVSPRLGEAERKGSGRDTGEEEGSRTNNALPSPVSPVRSVAALQEDAVFISMLDPDSQADVSGNGGRAVISGGDAEGDGAGAVGKKAGSRAWSPLSGVADGGGSALGLGYVRARSKSC